MLGAIIGDIVGSRFKYENKKTKEFELFHKDCHISDETVVTLAVATAITETEKIYQYGNWSRFELYHLLEAMTRKCMVEIGNRYPECGYKPRFKAWLDDCEHKPYESYGNGAAMRISPVAYLALTETDLHYLVNTVTEVTHNHKEGIKGSMAVAMAIHLARNGYSKEDIREEIEDKFYRLDFSIEELRKNYRTDLTCQGTVPQAIIAFLEADSFEDAIRNAVSIGEESDTVAAISGSIAEAYYGIPAELEEQAMFYLDEYLLGLYENCEYLKAPKLTPIFETNWPDDSFNII